MTTPREVLARVFGHGRFRGLQEPVIGHVLAGGDAVALMPTGGGKSLCYQIPALLRPGVGIVVSPLIALMRDQVQALEALGVAAACLNSSLSPQVAREVLRRLAEGRLDLLYLAPERFMTPGFLGILDRLPLALFAIDEAHCVSQWGHDFRPEYLQLAVIPERFPGVPRLALTATADGPTREDIVTRLGLGGARIFAAGFDRPNIRYMVEPKDHERRRLLAILRQDHEGESGIVYRLSRHKVESTAKWLADRGVPALAYHAGLSAAERDARQDRFMRQDGLVMVATIAFGMGVDKPDVRFVAHLDPPKSLEAYHQETGRAGRDGAPAVAWMFHSQADFMALRQLMAPQGPASARNRVELAKLGALFAYCEADTCRRQVLLGYFGEDMPEPCGNCDLCLDPAEPLEATVAAQKALSCVFRTGERFGAAHLTHVLKGRMTARVVNMGHDRVSTFGIGQELDEDGWRAVYRRLTALGHLLPDDDRRGGLGLTASAWDILKGRSGFAMRFPKKAPSTGTGLGRQGCGASRGARGWVREHLRGPDEELLWEALRSWRSGVAGELGVPPYIVFHDRALLDVVLLKPRDEDELSRAGGMGRAKIEKYGAALLGILAGHYATHGRGEARPALALDAAPEAGGGADAGTGSGAGAAEPGASALESLALFRELGSVAAVAVRRGLKPGTIHAHLLPLVRRGELSAALVTGFSEEVVACVAETIAVLRQAGQIGLAPVHEALGGGLSYEALRCIEAGARAGRPGAAAG